MNITTSQLHRREFFRASAVSTFLVPIGSTLLELRANAADVLSRPQPNEDKLPVISIIFDGGMSQRDSFDAREHPASDQDTGLDAYMPSRHSDLVFSSLFSHIRRVVDKIAVCRTVESVKESGFHKVNTELLLHDNKGVNWHSRLASSTKNSGHPYYYLAAHHWDIGVKTNSLGAMLRKENDPFHAVTDAFSFDDVHSNRSACLETDRLQDRLMLRDNIDTLACDSPQIQHHLEMQRSALALLLGDAKKFVSNPPKEAIDRYGKHGLPYYYAGQLVKQGATSVAVRTGSWDFHFYIKESMEAYAPTFDKAYTQLVEDVDRGDIPPCVISCIGEFGRTPKMSGSGRDHFETGTGLLYGGDVLPGVFGATDYHGHPKENDYIIPASDWKNVVFQASRRSDFVDNPEFSAPMGLITKRN
ncbi:MAG: DUF1501 domain-containing protein [Candidatus Peregrinibacteria bacterium]|nr:DUF1501 domain-containing protein [Candidatus Peregrinibacteria bacterium]MCB9808493.1 DUF1501 domain-containing protein [Candidatus Peribacteria bacterium]